MNRLWIPALVATAVFSANAFADHGWDDRGRHERHYRYREERVIVHRYYAEPQVVYQAPVVVYQEPPVVYRERIVRRNQPVYYEQEPRYYEQPAPRPSYSNGNRVIGNAVGAIAGGVIGNQIGQGNGRVAATALGAVVGTLVGGHLADPY